MKTKSDLLAVLGLFLGGSLGMAGTFVQSRSAQSILWIIDGTGLVMAATLIALKYFRKGNDMTAAGFLIFGLGSAVMQVGDAQTLQESVPSFTAGTFFWACGLLLISGPKVFPLWTRITGALAAVLFAITAF